MKVEIYGHSDDRVEIRGDIEDELYAYDRFIHLHFGDGTVIKAGHGQVEGKGWHIEAVKTGYGSVVIPHDPDYENGEHRTDRLVVIGDLKGMDHWDGPDGPTKDELVSRLEEDIHLPGLRKDELYAIYQIVNS